MEVHAHTHTPRKKWTHYLWEFLMLFLAVTLGFFVENQREHMVEHRREKQFIESYIEDLKTDTSSMRRVTTFLVQRQAKLDSFLLLLKSHQIKGFENTLYYFGRSILRSTSFQSNDRTMTQLLNSGSLRLIRKKEAAEKMTLYKKGFDNLDGSQQDENLERKNCKPLLEKIYDPFVFDEMVDAKGIKRIENSPPLRSYDPELQKDLAHTIHQLKGSCFLIINKLKALRESAANLIVLLKKEYHLD
jgi:hypothetical protein